MSEEHHLRREKLMDRVDEALNRWPRRDDPKFLKEITDIVVELDELAHRSEELKDEGVECSKHWRYAGMAHFERGMALHKADEKRFVEELTESSLCYERALRRLQGTNELRQVAITHLNYANTLRGLSDGTDVKILEMAERHYTIALDGFRQIAPENVGQTEKNLSTLQTQLSLAHLQERVKKKVSRFAELEAKLLAAGNQTTVPSGLVRQTEEAIDSGPSMAEILTAVQEGVSSIRSALGESVPEGSFAGLSGSVEALKNLIASATPSTGEAGMVSTMMALLRKRFAQDVAAGKVSPVRQKSIRRILGQLESIVLSTPKSLAGIADKTVKLRQLTASMMELLRTPSIGKPEPPEDSLAASILPHWEVLTVRLAQAVNIPNRAEEESRASMELMKQVSECVNDIYDAGEDDAATTALESETLLRIVDDVRQYLRRRHSMLAHPIWGTAPGSTEYRLVFYSGGKETNRLVAETCVQRHLTIFKTPRGENAALSRWRGLSAAGFCICDMSLEPGPALAQVAYELGIARAIGKPAIVLAPPERPIPFDVDMEPVRIRGTKDDRKEILAALDSAMYSIPDDDAESSSEETISYARRCSKKEVGRFEIKKSLEMLEDASADPILVTTRLRVLKGLLKASAPELIFPPWAPHYPAAEGRRCFHVMPFSEGWSDTVAAVVRKACEEGGVAYVRGDEAADPDIIHSIWDELCRASHVLVDLTGFNANVAFELGLSHAIGRNVCMVGEGDTVRRLFPTIAKLRVAPYRLLRNTETLQATVTGFLSGGGVVSNGRDIFVL